MSVVQKSYIAEVMRTDIVTESSAYLSALASETDKKGNPRPVKLSILALKHSRRVAFASAIVSYAVGLEPRLGAVITAGALIHDTGKFGNRILESSSELAQAHNIPDVAFEKNDPVARYYRQRHPYDSWQHAKKLWAHAQTGTDERAAGLIAFGHHTNFSDETNDYPSKDAMNIYKVAGDITDEEISFIGQYSSLLTGVDYFDALIHPEERRYIESRMQLEGREQPLGPRADWVVREAQIDLREPGHGLTFAHLGELMVANHREIEQYGAPELAAAA